MAKGIKALLFDLGGVLIEIDFQRVIQSWGDSAGRKIQAGQSLILANAAYHQLETDNIDFHQFYLEVNQLLALGLDKQQFVHGWNQVFIGPVDGVQSILKNLAPQLPMYVFSNTNRIHARFWRTRYASLLEDFEHIFTSFELGLRKPAALAFTTILEQIGRPAEEVLFFDDSEENIHSARQLGLPSVLIKSRQDIESALKSYKVI